MVKENIAGVDGEVQGVIISETADERIRYALIHLPNVNLNIYQQIDGELKLEEPKRAYLFSLWKKLTEHEKKFLLDELAKANKEGH